MPMTVIVSSRYDINLDTLRRVALAGESVQLAAEAVEIMASAHKAFAAYVDAHRNTFIYGVTSGWGPAAGKKRISPEATRLLKQQGSPWLGLSFGGGELPEYVSRGAVFAMLAMAVSGHAAAHPERARQLAELLDAPLPRLP